MPAFEDSAIAHANGSGPFAPNLTGLTSSGQLLLATCFTAQDSADFTAPAGWTLFGYKSGGGNTVKAFYKYATGTDGSPSFALTGSSAPTSVVVGIYSGVSANNPFDGFSQLLAFTNDATPAPPPFTSITDDALAALWMGSQLGTSMSGGAPSGYTLNADYSDSTYDDRQQFISTKTLATPGTETPGDWTHSASPGNTEDGYQAGIALQEQQGGTYPTVAAVSLQNTALAANNHGVATPTSTGATVGQVAILIYVFRGSASFSLTSTPTGYTRLDSAITGVSHKRAYVGWKEVTGTETFTQIDTSANVYGVSHNYYITGWSTSFPPILVEAASNDAAEIEPTLGSNLFIAALAGSINTDGQSTGLNGLPSGYNWVKQRFSPNVESFPLSLHTGVKERFADAEDPGAWDAGGTNWSGIVAVHGGDAGSYLSGIQDGWGIPI